MRSKTSIQPLMKKFKQAGLNFGVMDVASRTQDASGGTRKLDALI